PPHSAELSRWPSASATATMTGFARRRADRVPVRDQHQGGQGRYGYGRQSGPLPAQAGTPTQASTESLINNVSSARYGSTVSRTRCPDLLPVIGGCSGNPLVINTR